MVDHSRILTQSQPLRGPFTLWPRVSDAVLAVVALGFTIMISLTDENQAFYNRPIGEIPVFAFLLFSLAAASLLRRRGQPLAVYGFILVLSLLAIALGYVQGPLFPLIVSLYSVGRYVNVDRWSYLCVGATIMMAGVCSFNSVGDKGRGELGFELLFAVVFIFVVWYVGRRIRIRGDYLKLLQERAAQLEREQDREARRAVAEERARIAREMHDVVAHQVSLMTVQAGAAKTVVADDPGSAVKAMEAVEKAGREALNELRHLIGILRPDSGAGDLDPQPGLADVSRLVERLAETGLDVDLSMDGEPADLPARINLFTYRIVQEALTNVLKHAGPGTHASVRIGLKRRMLVIEVNDDGRGGARLPRSGHGIVGMRERAQLLGGSLEAGPLPAGGFRVVARLPLEPEAEDFSAQGGTP